MALTMSLRVLATLTGMELLRPSERGNVQAMNTELCLESQIVRILRVWSREQRLAPRLTELGNQEESYNDEIDQMDAPSSLC